MAVAISAVLRQQWTVALLAALEDPPRFLSLHTGSPADVEANCILQASSAYHYRPAIWTDTTITWDGLGVEHELEDEPYPCQLCWATTRWPWEPLRACPGFVDVELTYCAGHRAAILAVDDSSAVVELSSAGPSIA